MNLSRMLLRRTHRAHTRLTPLASRFRVWCNDRHGVKPERGSNTGTHTRGLIFLLQFKTHAYLFANTDEDGTNLKLSTALVGLTVVTGLVALLSEYLVDAIDGFTEEVRVCCRRAHLQQ